MGDAGFALNCVRLGCIELNRMEEIEYTIL